MLAGWEIVVMTWHDFVERTNINGVSNVGSAKSIFRKLVWTVISICGMVFTLIGLVDVITDYLEYDVSSTNILEHYSKITFPSVTFCNQNRVDCVTASEEIYACNSTATGAQAPENTTGLVCKFTEDLAFQQVIQLWIKVCDTSDSDTSETDSTDATDDSGNSRKKRQAPPDDANSGGSGGDSGNTGGSGNSGGGSGSSESSRAPTESELGDVPDTVDEEYDILMAYMGLSENNRKVVGHQFSNFIQDCVFRERDCTDESNFLMVNTPGYGNCFVFNSQLNPADEFGGKRVTSMTGPSFGLNVVLNVEQTSYQAKGSEQAGARVVVHRPDQLPLPMEYGRDLKTNIAASIGMQELTISRQPEPFVTNCSKGWDRTNYTDYVVDSWKYSLPMCQRLCLLSSFEKDCGCIHPLYLMLQAFNTDLTRAELCQGDDYECVHTIMEQLDNGLRDCSCHVDCKEIEYSLALSESSWPSTQYEAKAKTLYGTDSRSEKVVISENLLKVRAYFNSLNVQSIEETPVYDSLGDGTFIAALGGALGLYLGISLAMFFETIEFLIDLGINTYLYFAKGRRVKKETKVQDEVTEMD